LGRQYFAFSDQLFLKAFIFPMMIRIISMHGMCRIFSILALIAFAFGDAIAQEVVSIYRQDQNALFITAYRAEGTLCKGIAVISPGAGGSEKGYGYLGAAMSSIGYLAVVVGHRESGRTALREHIRSNGLREGLADLITDPAAYRGRFMDIAAAKEWASRRCNGSESILIGHSMGAATTMMEAGARNNLGMSGGDSFNAYIALSPQGSGSIFPKNAWAEIKRPVLMLTGTRDSELGGGALETRTEPFSNLPAGCKWLGVIEKASHMNFAGNGVSRQTETLTVETIRAFLDAMHRGDCKIQASSAGIELQSK
jgi:predicted dienelactone hydrolase